MNLLYTGYAQNQTHMTSVVFSGSPEEVQQQLSAFLKDKTIKIHGFAQSQSPAAGNSQCVVTTTILYAEYPKERKEVKGFGREAS